MLKNKVPIRSHSGNFRITSKSNKKYLSEDFTHRCAYCDDLDVISGGYKTYHVEHFAPKEKFPDLEFTYENLLYACPYCNCCKGDDWPSGDALISVVGESGYIDPCSADYQLHLDRNTNGSIVYKSTLGKYMFDHLNLGLIRHYLIYNVDKLQNKRNELAKKISEDKTTGKDTSKKEKLLNTIDEKFFKYYFQLLDEFST